MVTFGRSSPRKPYFGHAHDVLTRNAHSIERALQPVFGPRPDLIEITGETGQLGFPALKQETLSSRLSSMRSGSGASRGDDAVIGGSASVDADLASLDAIGPFRGGLYVGPANDDTTIATQSHRSLTHSSTISS